MDLAKLRKARGWTQAELAHALHVTQQAVAKWESGTSSPSSGHLSLLVRILQPLGAPALPLDTSDPVGSPQGVRFLDYARYGLFVLPESLPRRNRRRFAWSRANPVGSLKLLRSHHELLGLAGVSFLYYLAHQVLQNVFVLYAGYRYGWTTRTVGLTLAAVGIASVIVQGGLVRPLVARLGERRALLVGLTFGAAGLVVFGLASTSLAFCIGIPVFALIGLFSPSAQGLMTRRVQPWEQGQLQGANSSIQGITGMIGPGVFTFVFARAIDAHGGMHLPGAPFLLSAAIIVSAIALAARVTAGGGRREARRVEAVDGRGVLVAAEASER